MLASVFTCLDGCVQIDRLIVSNKGNSIQREYIVFEDCLSISEEISWHPSCLVFDTARTAIFDNNGQHLRFRDIRLEVSDRTWQVLYGSTCIRGQPRIVLPTKTSAYAGFEIDMDSLRCILRECRSVQCMSVSVHITSSAYLFRFTKNDSIVELTANGEIPPSCPGAVFSRSNLSKLLFVCLNTAKYSLNHHCTLVLEHVENKTFFNVRRTLDSAGYSTQVTLKLQSL